MGQSGVSGEEDNLLLLGTELIPRLSSLQPTYYDFQTPMREWIHTLM